MKSALEVKGILPLEYSHLDPRGAFHFRHDAANWYFPQNVQPSLLSSSACACSAFQALQAFDPACKRTEKKKIKTINI